MGEPSFWASSGSRLDVFLAEEGAEAGGDDGSVHFEVVGDLFVGPAVEDSAEDGLAAGGFDVEHGAVLFGRGHVEVFGAGDFAGLEQAAGEVADEVGPFVAARVAGGEDVVAFVAGEGGEGVCWVSSSSRRRGSGSLRSGSMR